MTNQVIDRDRTRISLIVSNCHHSKGNSKGIVILLRRLLEQSDWLCFKGVLSSLSDPELFGRLTQVSQFPSGANEINVSINVST
jgi:hypothetical protein